MNQLKYAIHTTLEHSTQADLRTLVSDRVISLAQQMSKALLGITAVLFITLLVTVPENRVMLSWLAGIVVCFSIGVYLQKQGFFQFNQFMLSTGLPLILLLSTIHSKVVNADLIHEGSYFNPRYFLIGLSFVPLAVFDLKSQSRILAVSLTLNLGILLLYIPIHTLFGADPEQILGAPLKNNLFITIASTSAALAIITGMYFLKKANAKYEAQIESLLVKTTYQKDELTAGIRYAEGLQRAVLPQVVSEPFSESKLTLFQRAKDTLSGDFFFAEQRGNTTYISVVDCTGHGVPGAFVSLMGHLYLKSAMDEVKSCQPNLILAHLHKGIQNSFRTNLSMEVKDGMDMAFMAIDHENRTISYASAHGIGYLVRANEVVKIESERRSIADGNEAPFQLFELTYEPGDLLFLSSDGYKDQFGGPRTKKFGSRQFQDLASELKGMSAFRRKDFLQQQFDEWKKDEEQTDDVCVLVFELP